MELKAEDRVENKLDAVAKSMANAVASGRVAQIGITPVDDEDTPTAEEVASFDRIAALIALDVELLATADMPLSLIVGKVRSAAEREGLDATEDEIQSEADRIWRSFDENRTGPREVFVNGDGTVADVRPAEMTPNRGPDVGTKVHQVTDEEPRFSGGGTGDAQQQLLFGVPIDRDFNGKLYRDAPDLANIAEMLIERHGFLRELGHCEIRYYWRRKTGVSKGRVKIGFCKRASDLLGHFSGADFLIWLSATTARDGKFTDRQVEAAIFHQLLHIETDDKGNFIKAAHDFEGFAQEVTHYGVWTAGLKTLVPAVTAAQQMGLFEVDDDEGIEDDDDEADEDDEPMGASVEQPTDEEPGPAAWERYRTTAGPAEAEPDTSDELPTDEEIDAAMTDRDPL